MTTYNQAFKLKIVKEYLDGGGSLNSLGRKYGVSSTSVSDWVKKYQVGGADNLKKKDASGTAYSVQFKLNAIRLYQTTDISYRKLADNLGLNSQSILTQWVKQYNAKGIEGISRTRSARKPMFKDDPEKKNKKQHPISLEEMTEEEVQDLILKLQIENDYLKELWSLKNQGKKFPETKKNRD
jgi:transposase